MHYRNKWYADLGEAPLLFALSQQGLKVPGFEIRRVAADAYRCSGPARAPASIHLCSLGTNTVLGNSIKGLLALLFDCGAVN